jgi:hypothetical protein
LTLPNIIEFHKNDNLVRPAQVDDEMRKHFGAEADPKNWYRNWFDTVAMCLAFGAARESIEERLPEKKDIIEWLFDNYTMNAYYTR